MTYQYWYMFPVAIGVATTAMASGVGGATFFAPILLLGLGVAPEVAIGTGLLTAVFGFASGLTAYARRRLIDYDLGLSLLVVTVPLAVLGSWIANAIDGNALRTTLGLGLLAVALSFLRRPGTDATDGRDAPTAAGPLRCLETARDGRICYAPCNLAEGRVITGVGALFLGMISAGLGELNGYFFLRRCRVPSKVAVATSVFIVAVSALAGAGGHLYQFVKAGGGALPTVYSIVVFTIPGVILGGQIGPIVARRMSQHHLERALGVLFLVVSSATLVDVFLRG